MDDALNVYTTKPWTDHTQGLVWTVNDRWYTSISLGIGVLFGLAQPCLERSLTHLFAWISYAVRKPGHVGGPEVSGEDTALLPKTTRQRRNRCSPSRETFARVLSRLLVIFGVAYAAAGAFVNTIPADKAALSGSKTCGLWGLKDNAKPAAQDADALIQGEKESRAGQYARDCYGPQSATSLDQCLVFKKPYIPTSHIETGQQCPFVNETYCPSTGFTAVRFTTGLVDATLIGVNAKKAPKFNRTMMCIPINMNPGFAEKTSNQTGHWGYDLGPVSSEEYTSKYTFRQYGDPFTYDVRSYTMSTYVHVYSKANIQNYWQPIPALNIRPELNTKSKPYSVTLMFINSCRIFYKEDSDDDIFPADRRWPRNPDLWINNDSRARPLACIDWIEVCTHEGTCLPPYQDEQDGDKNHVFTRYALNKSTAFHAIEFRGATGLDAQYKIKDDTSLPLAKDPPQWIAESWSLFNTSLSRIQYDALDVANGTDSNKEPYYVPKMPAWVQGKLCYIFMFQIPKGYDNIRIWPTIGILLIPFAFWLIGRETSEEFSQEKKSSGFFDDSKLIGMEWACWKIRTLYARYRDRQPEQTDQDTHDANTQGQGEGSDLQSAIPEIYGSIPVYSQPQASSEAASTSEP